MNGTSRNILINLVMMGLLIVLSPLAGLAEEDGFVVTIKDHTFSPAELTVPAHQKIKLVIENRDPTPEEFESFDLNREKVVSGKGKITVFLGPLKPGRYKYFGEFHQDTAQGLITAE